MGVACGGIPISPLGVITGAVAESATAEVGPVVVVAAARAAGASGGEITLLMTAAGLAAAGLIPSVPADAGSDAADMTADGISSVSSRVSRVRTVS